MTRLINTLLVALVSAIVIFLLADVDAGATDLNPLMQGYLAVAMHAIGFILVAATAAYLATYNSGDTDAL